MSIIELLKSSEIKINIDNINKLKNAVKNNFEKIEEVSEILNILPFLKDDIHKRMKTDSLFQPGRIVETIIIQSISDFLNCHYKGSGIYENDDCIIRQDGGSGKSDLSIFDRSNNIQYIFEIKEPVAYGKSCGFTYDDTGKPVDFTSQDIKYKEYVKSLFEIGSILENYNILDNIGHNKIFETNDIITNEFDYIISYDDSGVLDIMTSEEYKDAFDFKIEIRSCGRNTRKTFTKNKLDLNGDIVILKKEDLSEITQRGGRTSSRFKYIKNNATFSFKKRDVEEKDGQLFIHIDKVNQHVGEVSIQHFKKKHD
jgi:hypothetical protein